MGRCKGLQGAAERLLRGYQGAAKGLLRGCQGAVSLQRVARAGLLLDDETHRGAVQELDGGQRLTWWGWKVGVRVAARRRPRSRLGGGLLTAYYY